MERMTDVLEPVDRSYENVIPVKNDKKIQLYPKTFEKIHNRYWDWRVKHLRKKQIQLEGKIAVEQRIANDPYIGKHNVDKIQRKIDKMKDKIEFIELELETTRYPSVSVRLLKVVERARNRISEWWNNIIKVTPKKEKNVVMNAASLDVSEQKRSDVHIEPSFDTTKKMQDIVNDSFTASSPITAENLKNMVNSKVEAMKENASNKEAQETFSADFSDNLTSEYDSMGGSTYRLGREELAERNNGSIVDASNIMSPSSIIESQQKINSVPFVENNAQGGLENYFNNDSNLSNVEVNSGVEPIVVPEREPEETGYGVNNEYVQQDDMHYELSGEYNDSTFGEEASVDQMISNNSNNSSDNDVLRVYMERYLEQEKKRKEFESQHQEAVKNYNTAVEQNEKARDYEMRLQNLIAEKLTERDQELREDELRTNKDISDLNKMAKQIGDETSELTTANDSLAKMCETLGINYESTSSNDIGSTGMVRGRR